MFNYRNYCEMETVSLFDIHYLNLLSGPSNLGLIPPREIKKKDHLSKSGFILEMSL